MFFPIAERYSFALSNASCVPPTYCWKGGKGKREETRERGYYRVEAKSEGDKIN
jgi:hypothetical protein